MKYRRYINEGLAFGLGCLAALGQAPWSIWLITLCAFFLSFLLAQKCVNFKSASSVGFFTGLGYFTVSLFWITEPFLLEGSSQVWVAPFALLAMSSGLSLFWLLAYGLSVSLRYRGDSILSLIVLLTTAELIRTKVFSGFPWSLIGYVWSDHPISQLSAVVGPHGLTMITLLIAGLPLVLKPYKVIRIILPSFLLVGSWGYGYLILQIPDAPPTGKIVRLIQPNAPQNLKWDTEMVPVFWQRQLNFTKKPSTEPLDLIVWPETSVPFLLRESKESLKNISIAASGVPVIIGANDRVKGGIRNALALVGPEGRLLTTYHKKHLVPFGEYIPFGEMLSTWGVRGLATRDGADYVAGTGERLLEIPKIGRVIPLICYELIFPRNVRSKNRARLILQITNDAWFGNFSGPFQHLAQAKLRAIEQGLPLIRVANTGISAVLNSRGEVVVKTSLNEATYIDANIPSPRSKTIYAKFADWPMIIFLSFSIFTLSFLRKRVY